MNSLRFWHRTLLLPSLLIALTACQTHSIRPPLTAQQQVVEQIANWRAEGKISVKMEGKRETASFDWVQNQQNYTIHLFGPFGQGTTWLRRTQDSVSLENADIGVKRAANPEQLMRDYLGWQVPVASLQYWLRGLTAPRPTPKHLKVDEQGLLAELEQEGWKVNYTHYESYNNLEPYNNLFLPAKMTAQRGTINVTIAIKHWSLTSVPAPVPESVQ